MVNSTTPEQSGTRLRILGDGVTMLGSLIASPKGWLVNLGLSSDSEGACRKLAYGVRRQSEAATALWLDC